MLERWPIPLADPAGTTNSRIQSIFQSRDETLWFASSDGVSCYDANADRWRWFNQSDGLIHNNVTAIQQSKDSRLWFATFGGGVCCFTPDNEQWQSFSNKDGLLENTAQALLISEAPDGSGHDTLWLGTSAGLSCYDFASDRWQTMPTDGHLAGNDIQAIYQCRQQRIWFATTKGLSWFDLGSGQWRLLSDQEPGRCNVRAVLEDNNGILWFATASGLNGFDPLRQRWQSYTSEHGLLDNDVRALAPGPQGTLWVGSAKGLNCFNPADGVWTDNANADSDNEQIQAGIRALCQDSAAHLWVGGDAGLLRFDPAGKRWFSLARSGGLADDDVRSVYQTDDGVLWFATGRAGVSRFDATTCQWQSFNRELATNEVLTMQQDERNMLWFGTRHGISQLELNSGRWRRFVGKQELVNARVQSIYRDRGGLLWFGASHSINIYRFNPKLGQWRSFVQRQDKHPKNIQAILQSEDGDLWFATRHHGVLRLTPANERWKRFHTKNGLAHDNVQDICQTRDGALWFATLGGGVSQFDPATQRWRTYTDKDGLVSNRVQVVYESSDGALWFGTEDQGISRFDHKRGEWRTLNHRDGLVSRHIRAIRQSSDGALWIATDRGVNSIYIDVRQLQTLGAITTLRKGSYTPLLALDKDICLQARAGGLSMLQSNQAAAFSIACEYHLLALACVESVGVCYGGVLSGLRLSSNDRQLTLLTKNQGLPANTIHAIAPVPQQPQKLWVATAAGAALIIAEDGLLTLERRLNCDNQLPGGPVNTLFAPVGGGVFLAYNAYFRRWIRDQDLARQRKSAQVRYVSEDGQSGPPIYFYRARERLNNVRIRALSWCDDALWAATSAGLFKAEQPCSDNARFQLVTSPGSPQTALRQLKTHPLNDELWMLADAQQDVPSRVIGYHPGSDETITLSEDTGIPANLAIHDLAFNHDAELIVLAGSLLFRGALRVEKPKPSLQNEAPLAPTEALRLLTKLLAMQPKAEHTIETLSADLIQLEIEFNCPEILHGHRIPVFAVEPGSFNKEQINPLRAMIRQRLLQAEHRFELPFFIYCRDSGLGNQLIADGFDALVIDEVMLKKLLKADNPQQMFSGLLFTRGLLAALSPYRTEGAVHDPTMFYGRGALLRKLIQTRSPQFLLVGPRRVGKSSLLRRLAALLPSRHPDLQLEYIDLLGIKDPARVTRNIARKLKLPTPPPTENPQHNAVQLADLLRERFDDPERSGLILIDEADGLVEADAKADFPLLSELRSLQAEGLCSFILAGYWYLFRWTLDHHSPVHNFASVERLGPLEQDAGYNLVNEPMERLGVRYENPEIAERIVFLTGSYPSLIQFVCDQMLEQLKREQSLLLTAQHLHQVEQSPVLRDYLNGFFRFNTGPGTQILVYQLLAHDQFSLAEAHRLLEQTVEKDVPLWLIERMLLQLVIFGLVSELDDRYRWTIPLVRDTLQAAQDRDYRVTRLLQELPVDYAAWVTPMV